MKKLMIAVLCVASTQAFAQADTTAAPATTSYASVSVGRSDHTMSSGGYSLTDNATGVKFALGAQFNQYVGAELGFVALGETSFGDSAMTLKSQPSSIFGALTGTYPVSDKVAVTGKVGFARNKTKFTAVEPGYSDTIINDDATSAVYGIGARIALSDTMWLVAEYENFGKMAEDGDAKLEADLVSVGLRFSF